MPPRKAAADTDTPKILSRRTLVLINRDQTASTPRVVWAHEMPILEAVFGEGNVRVQEPEQLDDGFSSKLSPELLIFNKKQDPVLPPSLTQGLGFVFIGDPRVEFDRLCNLYGRHPEVNEAMAENVFGRFQTGQFTKLVGAPTLDDLPDDQLHGLCVSYGASAEQLKEAGGDLVKLACELGVEIA